MPPPAVHELVSIPCSPWSEKARWALDLQRVPYRKELYVPVLGEPALRLRLHRFTARITVPVLFTTDGRALTDSFEIARFAGEVGRGAPLFPAGADDEMARWNAQSEEILRAGRALSVIKATESAAGREEGVPHVVPKALRPLLGRAGVMYLRAKYRLGRDREAPVAAITTGLRALRAALGGRRYLRDALSYADVTMAVSMQLVAPVGDRYLRIGPATRAMLTDAPLVEEFADLVTWRDALYMDHSG
jgi:glutathione S-transferase